VQTRSGRRRREARAVLENGGSQVTAPSSVATLASFHKKLPRLFFGVTSLFTALVLLFNSKAFCQNEIELYHNAYGTKFYTIESAHFTIHYMQGLERVAREAGAIFEHLHGLYSKTYSITLPAKTTVLVVDGEVTNGLAAYNFNFITIWAHDFDFNMRGTHDWLKGVCTHEYAHIISITSSAKLPSSIPWLQFGWFSHPNQPNRVEALHVYPNEILPVWFAEGIAQYEDSRNGTDSWDSHRDMILRTLTLSGTLLSRDHISVFAGKADDMEKSYNHGFSLVKYISETYGYEKVVSILRECKTFFRVNFDVSLRKVLGISTQQLYADWKLWLQNRYNDQVKKLGKQTYGKKINKEGFNNYWPKFSPDEKKIFFLSNGDQDYSRKNLYSYSLIDTVKDDDKIKFEKGIGGFYSIHPASGLIAFTSMKSKKSIAPADHGGGRLFDAFIDTLPPEKPKFRLFPHTTERQVTEKMSVFFAVFSPGGDKLACAKRILDHFYLCIVDTSKKTGSLVYPDTGSKAPIKYIYSLDWSSDGRHIAISFIDTGFRKIGMYDTATHQFSVMKNSGYDDRDPRFSADGNCLYFSSDRTGIFNIYRHNFETKTLQRVTNVSGGGFAPDISRDGKKLVYTNYDKDGYGIYLLDSVSVLEESTQDSLFIVRNDVQFMKDQTLPGESKPYSHFPRQFVFVPTLISEQTIPELGNVFKGKNTLKAGCIVNVMDPLGFMGCGTEAGAYLLLEPNKIFQFINFDQGFLGKNVNYDLGIFGKTKLLPFTLSAEYLQRGITASDFFYIFDDTLGRSIQQPLNYLVTLHYLYLKVSHLLAEGIHAHILTSYNSFNNYILLEDSYGKYYSNYKDFSYTYAKGYSLGTFCTMLEPEKDSRDLISPRGTYAKVRYDFWSQYLLNSNGITIENGLPKENYDIFNDHQFTANIKYGMTSPWLDKHDFYFEANGTAMFPNEKLTNKLFGSHDAPKELPSFYKPAEWVHGYTYYILDTMKTSDGKNDSLIFDTALVSGNAVATVQFSYRFPLWPRPLIDKKLWFIYLDKLYGAFNFSSGGGWQRPADLLKFRREDWLSSLGAELRLEAQSFGFPLAIDLRYDRGLNKPSPIGGDHFTFRIGFSFDNWEYIDEPNYYAGIKRQ
jgi:Tol biopolymer transport system component